MNNPHILTLNQARETVARLKSLGKTIVLTNGCFDLLHAGHLACLKYAKSQGDILIVAVNSDLSVQRLKGSSRPVIPGKQRLELISELKPVDYVILFEEENAVAIVEALEPHVYVKGDDYEPRETPEGQAVMRKGGLVKTAPLVPGVSTTTIIEKICASRKSEGRVD